MSDSIIKHNDHLILCPEEKLAGESDLTLNHMEFVQQLCSHGIIPSKSSEIMNK